MNIYYGNISGFHFSNYNGSIHICVDVRYHEEQRCGMGQALTLPPLGEYNNSNSKLYTPHVGWFLERLLEVFKCADSYELTGQPCKVYKYSVQGLMHAIAHVDTDVITDPNLLFYPAKELGWWDSDLQQYK